MKKYSLCLIPLLITIAAILFMGCVKKKPIADVIPVVEVQDESNALLEESLNGTSAEYDRLQERIAELERARAAEAACVDQDHVWVNGQCVSLLK